MIVFYILKVFSVFIPVALGIAFLTLLERKVLSLIGLRIGPNKASFVGFLQPIGDAFKLANKQSNLLSNFFFFFYYFSSILMISMCFLLWMCLFVEPLPVSFKYGLLVFMLVLGFNSLNSIFSGWSTFGKYSLIGSVRTVSQLISYESVLYLCLFFFIMLFSTFSFLGLSYWGVDFSFLVFPICFYIWVPTFLAELNRTPYDFSEGESELVSGFNIEFGSKSFTLIFLAEYGNVMFFCILTSFFFFFFFWFFF